MSEPVALFKNYEILSGITLLIVSEIFSALRTGIPAHLRTSTAWLALD
jgi:hypothetical protein